MIRRELLTLIPIFILGAALLVGQADFNPWGNGCLDGQAPVWNVASGKWKCQSAGGGAGVPAGAILLIASGSCPATFSQVAALDGKTLIGTLAVHGDIGTTGGLDAVTPAGTNSGGAVNAHSGTAVGDHASHTHTYTQTVNHVHVENLNNVITGSLTGWAAVPDTSTGTSTASGYSTANPTGGVATGTTAGPGATLTHSVTQPVAHTFTQPTFTGTQFDNRSAFVRVIFCSKD